MQQGEETDRGGGASLRWHDSTSIRRVNYDDDTVESQARALKNTSDTQQSCSRSHKSHPAPSSSLSNTCLLLADSLSLCIHTSTTTLDNISHTDDFRAGKIAEHICCSSIIIMNWTVANFHYRL